MRKRKRKDRIAADQEIAPGGESSGDGEPTQAQGPAGDTAETDTTASAEAQAPAAQVPPTDELTTLRAGLEEMTDKHLRAVAELQNYRRRAAAENREAVRYASADLIRSLLPVVDDLERTLSALTDQAPASLVEGVKLVQQNLLKALESHHVQRIESVGQPFDPAAHEAMMQQPSADHPPGTVLEECQAGYRLWDRVLRHSKVVVSGQAQQAAEGGAKNGTEATADRDATKTGAVEGDRQ